MAGRRITVFSLFLALALLFALPVTEAQAQSTIPLIVKVNPGRTVQAVINLLPLGTIVDSIVGSDIYLVNVPNLPLIQTVLNTSDFLLGLVGIDWIEINTGVTEPSHTQRAAVQTTGAADWYKNQPAFQLIRAGQALPYAKGQGVIVADINTRVDASHPALAGHLIGGYDFIANKPSGSAALNQSSASFLDQSSASFLDQSSASFLDQSSASFLDQSSASFLDQSSASFLDQSSASFLDCSSKPACSHGTLTVGVIAAIAPGSMIMPLRAFDNDGASDLFTLAKAIRYAANNGAHVLNMSFGTLENSKALKNSIDYAKSRGVILVASAGNNNTSTPQYPAAWSGVLSTAATDLFDKKASFSNYGYSVFVDGPGVNVILPHPNGYYAIVSGTSFSAPQVAATAALIRSIRTTGIANSIASSAVDIDSQNPQYDNKLGRGRIDVFKAVKPY
jgi:subtilisin family serine protease